MFGIAGDQNTLAIKLFLPNKKYSNKTLVWPEIIYTCMKFFISRLIRCRVKVLLRKFFFVATITVIILFSSFKTTQMISSAAVKIILT